ncbi:type III PLP-dependent enzyme [Planktotalea arctica]|uniref:type III PLP-dependent enzyme n=1 Tax=Planktotalea arctica TaxID=1481893 RepID=UPI000A178236|nr:type III PLP-dependent enzyme [Planktotalea arctica]
MIHARIRQDTGFVLENYLAIEAPDVPFYVFSQSALQQTAKRFQAGFNGLVTYAVKANDSDAVLRGLIEAGLHTFDVASVPEMHRVRACAPAAILHYNNPVRSHDEVAAAKALGVRSFSVDCLDSLYRLGALDADTEISVRLHLPIKGATYDFGAKFGACPQDAEDLLRVVAARGLRTSMTFHPGTQCEDPSAWAGYVTECAQIAKRAGVTLARLNVGGGFPIQRASCAPDLEQVFDAVHDAAAEAFGEDAPALVCEPGRAMVAQAYTLALRVKWRRSTDGALFLNDGVYGALAEARDIGLGTRLRWIGSDGKVKAGPTSRAIIFGPTCDSLDRIPEEVAVPNTVTDGDYLILDGAGAYSLSLTTQFNGYGTTRVLESGAMQASGHWPRAG